MDSAPTRDGRATGARCGQHNPVGGEAVGIGTAVSASAAAGMVTTPSLTPTATGTSATAATAAATAAAAAATATATTAADAADTNAAAGVDAAATTATASMAGATSCGIGRRRRPAQRGSLPAVAVAPLPVGRPTGRRRRQRAGSVAAGWGTLLAAVGVAAVSAAATGAGDAAATAVPPPVGSGGGGGIGGGNGSGVGGAPAAPPVAPMLEPQEKQSTRLPANFCSAAPIEPDADPSPAPPRGAPTSDSVRKCRVLVSAQADDGFILYVDGVRLMSSDDWRQTIAKNVEAGPGSVIAVTACNVGGGGDDDQAYAKVDIHYLGAVLISDTAWKSSDVRPPGADATVWTAPKFDDSGWSNATEPELLGNVAPGLGPPRAKGIWTARKGPAQRVYLRSPPLPEGFCGPLPEPEANRGQPGATAAPGRQSTNSSGGVPVWGIAVAAIGGLTVATLALLGAVYMWCWPWGGGVYRVDEWHLFPPTTEGAAALDEEEARRVGASGGGLSSADALVEVGEGGDAAEAAAVADASAISVGVPSGPSSVTVGVSAGDSDFVAAGGGKPAAATGLIGATAKPPVVYESSLRGGSGTSSTIPVSAYAAEGGSDSNIPRPPTDGSRAPWFNR